MRRKNSLILFLLLCTLGAWSQTSRTIDSLMNIPLIQGTYSLQFPGGDLKPRFGFHHEMGLGFWLKMKKGWLFAAEANMLFGNQVKGDTANIAPLQNEYGQIIGRSGETGYYTDYSLFERGFKFPVVKAGKLFHKNWLRGSANSGPFIMAGAGYWRYRLKIHDIDRSIDQIKGDYEKGYDHMTGGLMTTQSIGYLYLDRHKLLNFCLSFDLTQGYTQNIRDWNMSVQGPIPDKRLDLQYGIKLSWYFPIYPKLASGYYYY